MNNSNRKFLETVFGVGNLRNFMRFLIVIPSYLVILLLGCGDAGLPATPRPSSNGDPAQDVPGDAGPTENTDPLWQKPRLESFKGPGLAEGERNVLVIHGFGQRPSDPCIQELMLNPDALVGLYDNVVAYRYPSAQDITDSARWLADQLVRLPERIKVDVVAYSEGGLVARYAIQRLAGFGERVDNLVTIATPHEGLLDYLAFGGGMLYEAVRQMRPGSPFLNELNADQPEGGTRYHAIAGRAYADPLELILFDDDGVVYVDSALGRNVLVLSEENTAVLDGLKHSPELNAATFGEDGMPCDEKVYEKLREWLGPTCGNGLVDTEVGEMCDGTNLNGLTCTDLGFDGGTLSCLPGCMFDTSGCQQSDSLTGWWEILFTSLIECHRISYVNENRDEINCVGSDCAELDFCSEEGLFGSYPEGLPICQHGFTLELPQASLLDVLDSGYRLGLLDSGSFLGLPRTHFLESDVQSRGRPGILDDEVHLKYVTRTLGGLPLIEVSMDLELEGIVTLVTHPAGFPWLGVVGQVHGRVDFSSVFPEINPPGEVVHFGSEDTVHASVTVFIYPWELTSELIGLEQFAEPCSSPNGE